MPQHRSRFRSLFSVQLNVVRALILRDLRTRFFGHGAGYLIAIAWPLVHIACLIGIYGLTGRVTPFGSSLVLYFAVGLAPVMSFIYASRWIMLSALSNKVLMSFPVVTLWDILLARAILETLASCCMIIVLLCAIVALGINVEPVSWTEALKALSAVMLLGIGVGFLNGLISLVLPMWVTGYALLVIVIYITSGVLFLPDQVPEPVRVILAWNPVLHAVEWMRGAYFGGYTSHTISKTYLIGFGTGSLFLALILMRYGRRMLLNSR